MRETQQPTQADSAGSQQQQQQQDQTTVSEGLAVDRDLSTPEDELVAAVAQILLQHKALKNSDLESVFRISCRTLGMEAADFENILARVSVALNAVGLSRENIRDQLTGERVQVIVNSAPYVGPTKAATTVAPYEFNAGTVRVLQYTVQTYFSTDRCRGVVESDMGGAGLPPRNELSQALEEIVHAGWLVLANNGTYFPSARLTAELQQSLESQFGDRTLLPCAGCKKYTWYGALCSNQDCITRLHISCYDAFYQQHPEIPKGECPSCRSVLPEAVPIEPTNL